jgi:hypothetical protein
MCYSEFNDIIQDIAAMDADVITIETSRSQMELLDAFADFKYPNDIGPGVYDIHSPRVPSTEEMVNLLRKAKSDNTISAYEDMFGAPYDFNKCPIAPLGIKVVAHIPPAERASWAQHGIIGFYVGPAPEHYRCYQIYIPSTKGIRVSDCLEWFPADILTANIDAKIAALPLLPPNLNNDCAKQRVLTSDINPHVTTGPKQRVLPVDNKTQLVNPKRQRLTNQYLELSPREINTLSKRTISKLNMRFVDDKDSNDIAYGIITKVVKHKKSNKLQYQYYNDHDFDEPPKDKNDYSYINIKYCLDNCKFEKVKPLIASLATYINAENKVYNLGSLLSKTQRRNKIRRQRPRLEWYQKLNRHVNSAISAVTLHLDPFNNYSALTAINLNKDGSLLTARSALNGPDKEEWLTVFGEEIDRLIDTKTAKFVHRHQIPSGKPISYYNPQLKVKMKDGKLVKRVRGTIGGDKLPYSGPSSAQTAALETVRILLNAIVSEEPK